MLTRESPADVQRHLQQVQERLAAITAEARRLEAEHDELVLRLTDSQGLHDRHPVAVR